ncbi:glycoside hydrolase domain-containing protein [Bacillus cereus]|uniref:glycoside hydrolase domain-containing protein n=1 Tax=Bacillus cereus TaxID=1396 RepID=UPI000BF50F22|nr:glycoside hydrolase domain-containing protein [Bacillus cereus]PEW06544.1 hypothetical protein CN440_26215 [Bacillus cereus]
MAFSQGFDKSPALNKDQAHALFDGNGGPFKFCGFYLGGPCYLKADRGPNNEAISFTQQLHQDYIDIGYKLGYIYVGRQDQINCNLPGSGTGTTDAQEAIGLAKNIGIPDKSVIYLDVEGGNNHSPSMVQYVTDWVNEINNTTSPQFFPGIYCSAGSSGSVAKQLYNAANNNANMWVAQYQCAPQKSYNNNCYSTSCTNPASINDLDPSKIFQEVYIQQYAGDVFVNYNNVCVTVDINVAKSDDPNAVQV